MQERPRVRLPAVQEETIANFTRRLPGRPAMGFAAYSSAASLSLCCDCHVPCTRAMQRVAAGGLTGRSLQLLTAKALFERENVLGYT